MALLPPDLQTKTMRYRSDHRRRAHLVGKLLLRDGLSRLGAARTLDSLRHEIGGKPVIPDGPSFSISHSGDLVACALFAGGEVGLDIEKIRDRRIEDFTPWFSPEEMVRIRTAPDPSDELIRLWTVKEALFKAAGGTMPSWPEIRSQGGDQVSMDGRAWHVRSISIAEGYRTTLVLDRTNAPVIIESREY